MVIRIRPPVARETGRGKLYTGCTSVKDDVSVTVSDGAVRRAAPVRAGRSEPCCAKR